MATLIDTQNGYNPQYENKFVRQNYNDSPNGWVIMDTWNNPYYPINHTIKYSSKDFDIPKFKKLFHSEYGGRPNDLFLPWHYIIDNVNDFPYVINSRPFNYKTYLPGIENKLCILLIGDSEADLYQDSFYKIIAELIINPFKIMTGAYYMNNTRDKFTFLTGKGFKKDRLFNYII